MTHHFTKFIPLLQQVVVKLGVHRCKTGYEYGLTNMLMGILGTLSQFPNSNLRKVAQENMITLPAASRMVNDLVKKNLITRINDSRDRRAVLLNITSLGQQVTTQVHQELGTILEKLLDKMSNQEQHELEIGLAGLVRAIIEFENEKHI